MRILIADDDALIRRAIINALGKLGYELEVARDGNEALTALLRPNPPHLAIVDCVMPGLSGLEVCRRFRKQPCQHYTYMMLLTGLDSRMDMLTGIEAGADSYLTKPFDADTLRAHVHAALLVVEQKLSHVQRSVVQNHCAPPAKIKPVETFNPTASQNGKLEPARVFGGSPSRQMGRTSGEILTLKPFINGAKILTEVFRGLGIEGVCAHKIGSAEAPRAELAMWSVLILPQHELWLDLTLETDQESANRLYRSVSKKAPIDPRPVAEVVREMLSVVQETFRAAFQREGMHAIAPTFPHAISPPKRAPSLTEARQMARYRFTAHGIDFAVTVSPHEVPSEKRPPAELPRNNRPGQPINGHEGEPLGLINQQTPLGEPQSAEFRGAGRGLPDWRSLGTTRRSRFNGEPLDD